MANVRHVLNVDLIVGKLRFKKALYAVGVSRGLRLAGLHLQRESQKIVPIDTGNLRSSAFTRREGRGFKTKVFVGYTAAYALFVHEKVDMVLQGEPRTGHHEDGTPRKGLYWDPVPRAMAKFLEIPIEDERGRMTRIVQSVMIQTLKL